MKLLTKKHNTKYKTNKEQKNNTFPAKKKKI